MSSSSAKIGWTSASGPKRSAVTWNPKPRIMLAIPSSQMGWRAKRATSQRSKPDVSVLIAPLRWHIDAVAVHRLAATASSIAFSIRSWNRTDS